MEEVNRNVDSSQIQIKDDEIDLIEVMRTIWAGRKLILKVTTVFILIGLVTAFVSKVEYEANCKLMPESQEGMKQNLGGLGSLAGLAGINLDIGGSGALTPELYPQIAKSTPFIMKIWEEPIYFRNMAVKLSSYTYFKEHYKPSIFYSIYKYSVLLPFQIKKWLGRKEKPYELSNSNDEILSINFEDNELLKRFKSRIIVAVDKKSGVISMSTEMPDPVAAAELAQLSIKLLTDYVTNYKISKAKLNFDFINERYEEAEIDFEKTAEELALLNDRNRNVVTALAQTELQRLQNEYNISFEVYKGLATQLEQAKITLKEETPVFTVLEPVKIPVKKSKPIRSLILIFSLFLGILSGGGVVLAKNFYINNKK